MDIPDIRYVDIKGKDSAEVYDICEELFKRGFRVDSDAESLLDGNGYVGHRVVSSCDKGNDEGDLLSAADFFRGDDYILYVPMTADDKKRRDSVVTVGVFGEKTLVIDKRKGVVTCGCQEVSIESAQQLAKAILKALAPKKPSSKKSGER